MRALLIVAVTVAAGAFPALAQPPPAASTIRVAVDVVVTPDRGDSDRLRVPAATSLLDGRDLPTLPIAHAGEALTALPGFTAIRSQVHAGRPIVSARGFFGGGEAEYVRLLVDGVPVGDVESGLIDWARVAISSIERVEAARGPAAALYGDAAIGGVIQILTRPQVSGARATLLGGALGTAVADASIARRGGRGGFVLSGAGRRSDGPFDHSSSRQLTVHGAAHLETPAWQWRWHGGADGTRYDEPGAIRLTAIDAAPFVSDPLHRFDATRRRSVSAGAGAHHATSPWAPQARVHVTTRRDEGTRTILLAPGLGDRRARTLDATAIGGSIDAALTIAASRAWLVRVGSDVTRERLDVAYRGVDGAGLAGAAAGATSGVRLRGSAFVASTWDATPRLRFSGALRWDGIDDDDFTGDTSSHRAWSPRAGAVVQLVEGDTGIAAFAQVSRAFKAPTIDQLFDPRPYPDFRGGTFTISNTGLVPQRAQNVEAGLTGSGAARWTAVAYRMEVENEIDFDVRTFSYGNIGRSTHTGLELDVEGRGWGPIRPTASYALARVVPGDGSRQLKNVPRHHATAGAWADLPWRLGVHARVARSAGAYLDDDNTLPLRSAATIDLRVRRSWDRLAVVADVLNATDRRYAEYGFTLADFAGRTVGYVHPGAPRAWRVGLTTTF